MMDVAGHHGVCRSRTVQVMPVPERSQWQRDHDEFVRTQQALLHPLPSNKEPH